MTPRFRGVPKKIAQFGEEQFNETGAKRVDVLRVKASTIRKHFRQLRGITYLVAVISLDRVRVYFFDAHGRLLIGENMDSSDYEAVRSKSRLLTSYEKPTPPTEEELRMEATEETRNMLSRAIQKVSRELAQSEPEFPELYVTSEELSDELQNFGMTFGADGALIFEESAVRTEWAEGVCLRAAFLLFLKPAKRDIPFIQCIGNAVSFSYLDSTKRESWFEKWIKISKESPFIPVVNHLVRHKQTYSEGGFELILETIRKAPENVRFEQWMDGLRAIHDLMEVSLETGDYHVIRRLCNRIDDVSAIRKRRDSLPKIHLGARAICNPKPLGLDFNIADIAEDISETDSWLSVEYFDGSQKCIFAAGPGKGEPVESIDYYLNIDDLAPKPGGIQPRMRDIVYWTLDRLGIQNNRKGTFKKSLAFEEKQIGTTEAAVLERLLTGDEKVLSNTLLGSPGTVKSLIEIGCIALFPSFNHLGIRPNYFLGGGSQSILNLVESCAVEGTTFISEGTAYSIVSCPSAYGKELLSRAGELGRITVHPIANVESKKRIVRDELLYRDDSDWFSWTFSGF